MCRRAMMTMMVTMTMTMTTQPLGETTLQTFLMRSASHKYQPAVQRSNRMGLRANETSALRQVGNMDQTMESEMPTKHKQKRIRTLHLA